MSASDGDTVPDVMRPSGAASPGAANGEPPLGAAARAEPLKTGVDGTFAPHAMPTLSGGVEGFNIDLANEIGDRTRRGIVIESTQFSGLLPGLQAGSYETAAKLLVALTAVATFGARASAPAGTEHHARLESPA